MGFAIAVPCFSTLVVFALSVELLSCSPRPPRPLPRPLPAPRLAPPLALLPAPTPRPRDNPLLSLSCFEAVAPPSCCDCGVERCLVFAALDLDGVPVFGAGDGLFFGTPLRLADFGVDVVLRAALLPLASTTAFVPRSRGTLACVTLLEDPLAPSPSLAPVRSVELARALSPSRVLAG